MVARSGVRAERADSGIQALDAGQRRRLRVPARRVSCCVTRMVSRFPEFDLPRSWRRVFNDLRLIHRCRLSTAVAYPQALAHSRRRRERSALTFIARRLAVASCARPARGPAQSCPPSSAKYCCSALTMNASMAVLILRGSRSRKPSSSTHAVDHDLLRARVAQRAQPHLLRVVGEAADGVLQARVLHGAQPDVAELHVGLDHQGRVAVVGLDCLLEGALERGVLAIVRMATAPAALGSSRRRASKISWMSSLVSVGVTKPRVVPIR